MRRRFRSHPRRIQALPAELAWRAAATEHWAEVVKAKQIEIACTGFLVDACRAGAAGLEP